jgi:SAM-dependent MidA family methyltransferase
MSFADFMEAGSADPEEGYYARGRRSARAETS